jgi:hypothetical protein
MMSKILLLVLSFALGFTSRPTDDQFITTTPCHDDLRKIHNIPPAVDCSVINWDLKLAEENGIQSFVLKSDWGYYVNNRTLEKRGAAESTGTWKEQHVDNIDRITLTSENGLSISFRKLDLNHLHALDAKGKLAKGDDGYSFTLNKTKATLLERKNTITSTVVPSGESFIKTIFAGRTPCQDIASQVNIKVDEACFKLKWKLTLFQDSITRLPSSYELSRTYHRSTLLKGNWKIFSATINNRKETLYQLDPDKPEMSVILMKGDDNVLFFLDKNLNLLPGGNEFGYTLNRR